MVRCPPCRCRTQSRGLKPNKTTQPMLMPLGAVFKEGIRRFQSGEFVESELAL